MFVEGRIETTFLFSSQQFVLEKKLKTKIPIASFVIINGEISIKNMRCYMDVCWYFIN
jgi:hypothetical protein